MHAKNRENSQRVSKCEQQRTSKQESGIRLAKLETVRKSYGRRRKDRDWESAEDKDFGDAICELFDSKEDTEYTGLYILPRLFDYHHYVA